MTKHQTGTREEWLKARIALLEQEKELTRQSATCNHFASLSPN
jgi:predicted dithiol-disulfide oxidoreductase (DUF899 family)